MDTLKVQSISNFRVVLSEHGGACRERYKSYFRLVMLAETYQYMLPNDGSLPPS